MENWASIPSFPGYSVSDNGRVRYDEHDRILARLVNTTGIVYVGMFHEGAQHNRGVARLVAEAFLPTPIYPTFDTPINLDGDRTRLEVTNLMWRPRWFAVKYHQQFKKIWSEKRPIVDVATDVRYKNSMHAAMTHGLLALDVFEWALMFDYYMDKEVKGVWPTNQRFRHVHIIPRPRRGL